MYFNTPMSVILHKKGEVDRMHFLCRLRNIRQTYNIVVDIPLRTSQSLLSIAKTYFESLLSLHTWLQISASQLRFWYTL